MVLIANSNRVYQKFGAKTVIICLIIFQDERKASKKGQKEKLEVEKSRCEKMKKTFRRATKRRVYYKYAITLTNLAPEFGVTKSDVHKIKSAKTSFYVTKRKFQTKSTKKSRISCE